MEQVTVYEHMSLGVHPTPNLITARDRSPAIILMSEN